MSGRGTEHLISAENAQAEECAIPARLRSARSDRQTRLSGSIASATFDFSHPSNFSVNHAVSPVTESLSNEDGERLPPDSALP